MAGPYADNAAGYWQAGWRGVLPLPPGRKGPPPEHATGRGGTDPSWPDIQTWADNGHGGGNIALRMPPGTVGIDVDAYGGKPGAATLDQLQRALGPLPPTWMSTSRDDGTSGIRFYTVPPGTELLAGLPGIEIIQRHHRYAVVAPSIHPEGRTYHWVDQATGETGSTPPAPDRLVELPAAWLAALTAPRTGTGKDRDADTARILAAMPDGPPCKHVRAAAGHAAAPGARHDAYLKAAAAVAGAGRRGCPGAPAALARLAEQFTAETCSGPAARSTAREAAAEWERILTGALQLVAAQPQGDRCADDLPPWAPQPDPGDPAPDPYELEVARETARLRIRAAARQRLAEHDAGHTPDLDPQPLDEYLNQPDPEQQWTVPDLWPAAGRVLLVAAAKSGKTTMVGRNLLPCLADGGQFLGRWTVQPVDGRILYLNMEVGADQMRRWLRGSGITGTGRIDIVNLRGRTGTLPLHSEAGRANVAAQLAARGIRTVILDPLAPLLAALGLDEDSNSDVARFWEWWSDMLARAGCAGDVVAHHTGHEGKRSRGASRLIDEPDAVWTINRPPQPEGGDDDEIETAAGPRWFAALGRDVDLPPKGLLHDPSTGRLTVVDGTPGQQRKAAQRAAYDQRILGLLAVNPAGLPRRTIVKAGGREANMSAALDRLVQQGKVWEEKRGAASGGDLYWLPNRATGGDDDHPQ